MRDYHTKQTLKIEATKGNMCIVNSSIKEKKSNELKKKYRCFSFTARACLTYDGARTPGEIGKH